MAIAYSTQGAISNQKGEGKGYKRRMGKMGNKCKSIRS